MLPVTHGVAYTKINILLYTILLFAVSLLPFVVQMSGIIYAIGAVILNSRFLYWTIRLKRTTQDEIIAMRTFRYSIFYLTGLFVLLLVDHYLLIR
jgi:protoheme IX farnesyltransferase